MNLALLILGIGIILNVIALIRVIRATNGENNAIKKLEALRKSHEALGHSYQVLLNRSRHLYECNKRPIEINQEVLTINKALCDGNNLRIVD